MPKFKVSTIFPLVPTEEVSMNLIRYRIFWIGILFLASSCNFSLNSHQGAEKAFVSITVRNSQEAVTMQQNKTADTERTAYPVNNQITSVYLKGNGPQGLFIEKSSTINTFSLELAPGTWTFYAEGRGSNSTPLAAGSLALQLQPGESKNLYLTLIPLEGNGQLSISWTIIGDLAADAYIQFSLTGPQNYSNKIEVPCTQTQLSPLTLSSGNYTITAHIISQNQELCGLTDSVLIMANQETVITLAFSPPTAKVSSTISVPLFIGTGGEILPKSRSIASTVIPFFKVYSEKPFSNGTWYLEGTPIPPNPLVTADSIAVHNLPPTARSYRLDWIGNNGALSNISSTASIIKKDGPLVAPFTWAEKIYSDNLGSHTARIALENCKDIALSTDGSLLALVSKDKNSLGLFSYRGPGSLIPLSSFSSSKDPRFQGPVRLQFIPNTHTLLVLCETTGTLFSFHIDETTYQLSLFESLQSDLLIGAYALALLTPQWSLISNPTKDRVYVVNISNLQNSQILEWASPSISGLERFSKPTCMAINTSNNEVAIGTLGDDSIYIFSFSSETGLGTYTYKLPKELFSTLASLSDPVDMAFTNDGTHLFVLSYYGKALIQLDKDIQSGSYTPVSAIKSGTNNIQGFNYPQRFVIVPNSNFILITANGTGDGISIIQFGTLHTLQWLGYFSYVDEPFGLIKPTALFWDPISQSGVVGSNGEKSLIIISK